MSVRPARPSDRDSVFAMMAKLWPEAEDLEFNPDALFVWQRENGHLGGFASFSLRAYVDGCDSMPCPHVEGWWVDEDLRRTGVGRALIAAIEDWASERGFVELGSDALLANTRSHSAHQSIGFEPTEQLQYFRKAL